MATIVFAGQLQPTSRRAVASERSSLVRRPQAAMRPSTSRRAAIHTAARTREIQRVYRRRRTGAVATLAAVAMAAVISVFSLFGSSAMAGDTAGRDLAPKYVVAQPGDTLWSIGQRIAPNASITEVVDELVRLNGTAISSGQLVRIP
ncbi:MAG: LysM peptidoglycan-binding domain-containing protein [Ilumatobacteraceae bacterium]